MLPSHYDTALRMEPYPTSPTQPAVHGPMVISLQGSKNPTDTHTKDRSRCASLISHLDRQLKHQSHIAIGKALLTPVVAMICIVFGQILQRAASASKAEYQAPLSKSLLAGLVGGQCLVGSVVVLHVLLDTGPTPGRLWHRHITFTSMFIMLLAAVAAGPLGTKIIDANNDSAVLDPRYAFYSSSLGAGLLFWVSVIIKALLLTPRKLDAIDSYNSTSTLCTEVNWNCCPRGCMDCDCNCCRGCTNCSCCDSRYCDCCDCCKSCGGCGGCGGCDCNCNC